MVIPTKDFAECFEQWKRCWGNCVRPQREGDGGITVLCTMFFVSSSINVSVSQYMAGYFLDRTCIVESINLHSKSLEVYLPKWL